MLVTARKKVVHPRTLQKRIPVSAFQRRGRIAVKARCRELIDELGCAHSEAARLSENLFALKAAEPRDLTEIFFVRQSWQSACDHATELAEELRSVTSSVEQAEDD
jgi:hypothetical protein